MIIYILNYLDSLCTASNIDLRATIRAYLINKGYSTSTIDDQLDCLFYGFYDNGKVIRFYVRLVNSNLGTKNGAVIKTWNASTPSSQSNWTGVYIYNNSSVSIDHARTLSNPVLQIDYTTDGSERWAPFRRCYCSMPYEHDNDEDPGIGSQGFKI